MLLSPVNVKDSTELYFVNILNLPAIMSAKFHILSTAYILLLL
jgi:hypothetical protein